MQKGEDVHRLLLFLLETISLTLISRCPEKCTRMDPSTLKQDVFLEILVPSHHNRTLLVLFLRCQCLQMVTKITFVFVSGGFQSINNLSFFPDDLYNRIKQEWKRLKRRKQLKYGKHSGKHFSKNGSGSSSGSDNDEYASTSSSRMANRTQNSSSERSANPGALFTLEQVVTICNKLLVDRDNTVREEYDRALTEKLAGIRIL